MSAAPPLSGVLQGPLKGMRVVTTVVPVQMSRSQGAVSLPQPLLGEHSASILSSLGYSAQDITRLSQTRLPIPAKTT
ncbi:MAG: hypothetical protein Q7T63_09925 [Burkholderiaceae bacterium]|nr:hypothetical protein [Burkholderiaceae bacterium]